MNLLVLDATSKSIRGVLASGSASANPQFTVHYMDVTASTAVEGNIDGNFNGVTNVEVCAAPGASTRRIIREIVVYNADTASITFSIMLRVTATDYYIAKVTLGVNGTWTFDGTMPTYDIAAYMGYPSMFERDVRISGDKVTVTTPNTMWVNINGVLRVSISSSAIALGTTGNWDTITPTDYTVAANRAGKDFYIYACENNVTLPKIVLSVNSTAPSGYTSTTSVKIGGFHCLAVAVGTISGHSLTGYIVGDILPASVWDLKWKPRSAPEGMVYSAAANIWVDIYLMSGTGVNTKSVNGGTISDTRNWMDFIDDAGAVGKRLLRDREFQLIAAGCNEGTNITGSADPNTTGGHVDTAGRRMISNIGCEDCAGTEWQWLDEQTYQHDTDTFSMKNVTGGKGQLYTQGTYGDSKLLAGGGWGDAADCGSRGRFASLYRWSTGANVGGRAGVEPG